METLHKCGNGSGRRCEGVYQRCWLCTRQDVGVSEMLAARRSEEPKTSLWYQTRLRNLSRRLQTLSVTNTDTTNGPADASAFLSLIPSCHHRSSLQEVSLNDEKVGNWGFLWLLLFSIWSAQSSAQTFKVCSILFAINEWINTSLREQTAIKLIRRTWREHDSGFVTTRWCQSLTGVQTCQPVSAVSRQRLQSRSCTVFSPVDFLSSC